MKKEERNTDTQSRLSEIGSWQSAPDQDRLPAPSEAQNPLNSAAPDKDRAALLHIGAAVTPLIEQAEQQKLTRLCRLLKLVKSEAEAQLRHRDGETV